MEQQNRIRAGSEFRVGEEYRSCGLRDEMLRAPTYDAFDVRMLLPSSYPVSVVLFILTCHLNAADVVAFVGSCTRHRRGDGVHHMRR